jgi:shikimate kinase
MRRTGEETKRLPRRVVITGFMAAGKTTVALALARLLDDSAIDLDELVTESEGRTPQALIDEEGEDYFREAETRALQFALEHETARVIATGGGTWTLERNRAHVRAHVCLSVWLDAPFELCWQRIERAGNTRPLARDKAKALQLYQQRRGEYALAELQLRVTPEESADTLAEKIRQALAVSCEKPEQKNEAYKNTHRRFR